MFLTAVGFLGCSDSAGDKESAESEPDRAAELETAVPNLIKSMVTIPGKSYKMGKCEVTQAQWEAVMGTNPSHIKGGNNPVEHVSWNDCQEFLKRLNASPEVKQSGLFFRLPTDVEWEYACRADSTGDYCKLTDGTEIGEATLGDVAWYEKNAQGVTHPVGKKKPNAFGLYDMHGNVEEWCKTKTGDLCTLRGGSWKSSPRRCTCVSGEGLPSSTRFDRIGFRLLAHGAGPAVQASTNGVSAVKKGGD